MMMTSSQEVLVGDLVVILEVSVQVLFPVQTSVQEEVFPNQQAL